MGNLRTEHEELKTMFKTLKNTRETFITDGHHLKNTEEATTMETKDLYKPNIDGKHKLVIKRPYRLLPLPSIQK